MDCVKVSGSVCTIVEIKPNNSSAISKGETQVKDYLRSMRDYFEANKSRIKDAFSGELEVFRRCISGENIELKTEIRVYELCPSDGALFRDFVVE